MRWLCWKNFAAVSGQSPFSRSVVISSRLVQRESDIGQITHATHSVPKMELSALTISVSFMLYTRF